MNSFSFQNGREEDTVTGLETLHGIPEKEPRFNYKEADIQRAVEESLKSVHDAPRGPLPSVVIRELDSVKFQPLLKVGSDPGDDAEPQPQSSPFVHAGPNLKHIDLEATVVSTQLHPNQMDERFTVTALPNVQENLKLTVEEHKKKRYDSPKTPPGSPPYQLPPLPPPAGPSGTSKYPGASKSLQVLPLPPRTDQETWTTTNTRLRPSVSSILKNLHMDDDMALDEQLHSSDDEDIESAHIPKVNLKQDWWKPLEEDKPATPEPAWSILSSDLPVPTNNWVSTLASTYTPPPENSLHVQTGDMSMFMYQIEECHKLLIDSVDESIIKHNVIKPLPLGGPPGQVTIQSDFFFNKDLEYLRYDSKGGRPALSISKMKVAYYPDAGLEQMVPDQIWIKEECKYDIAAMYGISHWWMNSGLNIRFWTKKDVDMSKELMFAIQKRLKTKRIFRNLENFFGGRKSENKERVPTEMELELEQTQQGFSYEVLAVWTTTSGEWISPHLAEPNPSILASTAAKNHRIMPLVSDGNLRSCFLGRKGLGGSTETRRENRVANFSWIRMGSWIIEVKSKVTVKQARFREFLLCREGNQEKRLRALERYNEAKKEEKIGSLVIDYEDDYQGEIQGDAQEDKLTTIVMLLAQAITQCYFTPTNNRLHTSLNTRNQAVVQDGRVDIQSRNVGYVGNGKDCMLDNAYGDNTLEELSATVIMMARVQPVDDKSDAEPKYDVEVISEVNASQINLINGLLSKGVYEHKNHEKLKTVIHTSANDQIDFDIILMILM
uniref:Uncharacterized protein n=1 Tax=Tanacetum cinerariifolium TaxID=118510 RepID=A0A6L2KB22_TANCI|nr:hypothetical protein [Tanacetum cinerariifolium]